MMTNWANICRLFKYADKSTEMTYQNSIKDLILENCLGWQRSQIREQPSLQLGSVERLIPDIVVTKDPQNLFIIEVKRPDHIRTRRNIEQLISYMKQLETPVGIYIGEIIEVYYKNLGDGSAPTRLMSLPFDSTTDRGDDFVSLFEESNFSIERITQYRNLIEAQIAIEKETDDIISTITAPQFSGQLHELLKSHFLSEGKTPKAVSDALDQISITISSTDNSIENDNQAQPTQSLPYDNGERNVMSINRPYATARQYAYNLVRQILLRNKNLTFRQLYNIFGNKGYIEDFSKVANPVLWYMDRDLCVYAADGTRVVISNQWGFKGNCKPKMDKLKMIAKEFDINI